MANSVLHYVASAEQHPWGSGVGNITPSAANYTNPIVPGVFYAYTAGYTTGSGVANGKTKGYLVKAILKCLTPITPSVGVRKVTLRCIVYVCRKDGYTSNNVLKVKLNSGTTGISNTYNKSTYVSTNWVSTADLEVSIDYWKLTGERYETFTITGSNETGTCASFEDCVFKIQLPNIGPAFSAATFNSYTKDQNIGSAQVFNIKYDTGTVFTLAATYLDDDNAKKTITISNRIKVASYSWTPSFATILPNLTKKNKTSVTYTLTTYLDDGETGAKVASAVTASGTLVVPNDDINFGYKINSVTISDTTGAGNTAIDPTVPVIGYEAGRSKPDLDIVVDDTKIYGATIASIYYQIGIVSKTFTGDEVVLDANKHHNYTASIALISPGSYNAIVTLTDSRGNSISREIDITAGNAAPLPDITSMIVNRGTGSTIETFIDSDVGENIKVYFTAESSKIKDSGETTEERTGTLYARIRWKEVGETSYPAGNVSDYQPTTTNGVYELTGATILTGLDMYKAYVIRVEVRDPALRYRETNISAANYFVELSASGAGLSVGEPVLEDQTDIRINFPVKFNKAVLNSAGTSQFTSDERKKNTIQPLENTITEDILLKLYAKLDPITFKYNDDSSDQPLTHFGFSANKLQDLINSTGLNANDYSLVQEYEDKKYNELNPKENIIDHFLTLSYEELTPINFLAIKLLMRELISIDNRIKEIEDNGKTY